MEIIFRNLRFFSRHFFYLPVPNDWKDEGMMTVGRFGEPAAGLGVFGVQRQLRVTASQLAAVEVYFGKSFLCTVLLCKQVNRLIQSFSLV